MQAVHGANYDSVLHISNKSGEYLYTDMELGTLCIVSCQNWVPHGGRFVLYMYCSCIFGHASSKSTRMGTIETILYHWRIALLYFLLEHKMSPIVVGLL